MIEYLRDFVDIDCFTVRQFSTLRQPSFGKTPMQSVSSFKASQLVIIKSDNFRQEFRSLCSKSTVWSEEKMSIENAAMYSGAVNYLLIDGQTKCLKTLQESDLVTLEIGNVTNQLQDFLGTSDLKRDCKTYKIFLTLFHTDCFISPALFKIALQEEPT